MANSPFSVPPPAAPTAPPGSRSFTDYDTTRQSVYDGVIKGLGDLYPLENTRHRLELHDVAYTGPNTFSMGDEKKAILERKTLSRRLKGTWKLVDKADGRVLDEKEGIVGHVPHLTRRGTYIVGGSEYTVANQMRLRPGIYTRIKDNGEYEAHFNIFKGGKSFRVFMEPETGVFRMQIGQGMLKLYPILKAMGVSDKAMKEAWGDGVWRENYIDEDKTTLRKAYDKLNGSRVKQEEGEPVDGATVDFKAMLGKLELDPEVTKRTLGKPHTAVTPEAMMDTTSKLLQVSRKQADPDDRDSLAFQTVHSAEDFLRERIAKDAGRVAHRALWKATFWGNLQKLHPGMVDSQIESLFYKSGVSQPLEEINPIDALDQNLRVTRMGEGGIPSDESVPDEARSVQPSHFMFIDPVRSPESGRVGVDSRATLNTFKGEDGRFYTQAIDVKTGKLKTVTPQDLVDSVVAFPGELSRAQKEGHSKVRAMKGGRLTYVDSREVDYAATSPQELFTIGSNLVPMISAIKGGRLLMGAKMAPQALPIRNAEAPLVQSAAPGGGSFEQLMGKHTDAHFAKVPGTVVKVTPDEIQVKGLDGQRHTYELYNNFPMNRKTYLHSTPVVKPGDLVSKGQTLARGNFTDEKGTLALGTNLRVGYMPYRGLNYEDAIVVSQAAADKLTSEHMYTEKMDVVRGITPSRNSYVSMFPSTYVKQQLDTIGDDGVVKPGTVVKKDDPLILATMRKGKPGQGTLSRASGSRFRDASVTWGHDFPGVVTDVYSDDGGIKVAVKAYTPVLAGDKLSNRFGGKGVVSAIIPNDEMVRGADGKPLDIVLNPLGVISRVNPAQLYEAILGKIARKRGKPYVVQGFQTEDLQDLVEGEMKKYGVSDTEDVHDPKLDRKIPGVFVGEAFFHKLHHTAESKESGRGLGAYSSEGEPAAGDDDSPKRVGTGELAALISHGAVANIRDIKTIRGQRNDDYWAAVIQGYPPPTPGIPNMYKKFLAALQGAGINVKKEGNYLHLLAMTDKDVDQMSSGPLQNSDTVRWKSSYGREAFGEKSMDPVEGGLFDLKLTGGHGGGKWSHIQLKTAVPQPVMEEPIRRMLGLTKKAFEDTIAGRNNLSGYGTGTEAIGKALGAINVDQQINAELEAIKTATSATRRDGAIKRLKYLKGIKDSGIHPRDLMVNKVPVLPPIFRPITATDKFDMVAGANLLYKDLMDADSNYGELSKTMQGEPVGEARLATYKALKAVTGLGDPIKPERVQQKVHGLLEQVFGCYDDATEILTTQGWVSFPQYQGGVDVATLNPRTHAFEWQRPTEVQHYRYQGELVQLAYRNSLDLLVTPNHRNFVHRRGGAWQIEQAWGTASETNRTWLRAAAADWQGHRRAPDFVRATVLEFARFVGWWVAEGYFHQDGGVELDQATRSSTECREIDRLVGTLGLPVSIGVYPPSTPGKGYSNRRHWAIKSTALESWLRENAGSRSEGKVLSREILDWDKDILIEFILGYLHGDGEHNGQIKGGGRTHRRVSFLKDFTRFSTTSFRLFEGFQEIGLKVGVVIRKNKLQPPQKPSHHQQYRGSLHGDGLVPYEGRIGSFVSYDGYVHCVTVPNGLVFVRRGGKPIVSGNSSPKMGLFQRKLLGSSVDVAARATITPNPSLDMDQIGMPEEQAWKLYAPFVTRNLVRRFGNRPESRAMAVRMVVSRDPAAKDALRDEMSTRPVLATRAPALHRYSIMAFYPVLTKGHTLQLSPSVTPGFNADFDGDAMNFHVVISDEAIREAKRKMLPSQNLKSGADFSTMWGPRQEFLQGLYAATAQQSKKAPRIFATRQAVLQAFRSGQIDVDDPVVIAKS